MFFPISLFSGLRGQENFIVPHLFYSLAVNGNSFEYSPPVFKRKIVEYSATQSLNQWASNFHFQTDEYRGIH